jgi:hypothetical protein
MPYPYITKADLENRVSPIVVKRVLGLNPGAIEMVLADASSIVAGYLRTMYSLDALAANTPQEVKRLALDAAHYYLVQRFPELHPGHNPVSMLKNLRMELMDLRDRRTSLDTDGSPEPAAQTDGEVYEGGMVVSDAPDCINNWSNDLSKFY